MLKRTIAIAAVGTVLAGAAPASAHDHWRGRVFSDSNSHYLDYKTDLSEARRELDSDLARANDEQDRIEAYAEYDREVADAETDFRKEMAERGVAIPPGAIPGGGRVTLEDVAMVSRRR